MIVVFIVGYAAIALEHPIKVDKAASALIIGGFIKNPYGNFITRIAGFTIVILMINIFVIAHSDWFINTKLFTSVQIFLFIGGLYFLIKGNRS